MTDWLKTNWYKIISVITLLLLLIVLFQTCNRQEYAPVIIFPDSTDKAIDIKLDSAHKSQITIELQPQIIQQKYYNETNNYISLPDSSKPAKCMELARKLLYEK